MATTTQFVDAKTRSWATGLLERLDIPTRLLPATRRAGRRARAGCEADVSAGARRHAGGRCPRATTPVRRSRRSRPAEPRRSSARAPGRCSAPNCDAPVITPRARDLNFTNEGGVCGTTRLLKNIGGLWLLQACRRSWAASRAATSAYETLLAAARDERHAFRSLFDPDHPGFFQPRRHARRRSPATAGRPASRCRRRRRRSRARSSRASRSSTASCSNRSRRSTGSALRRNSDRRRRIAQPAAEPVHRGCHRPHRRRGAGRSHRARQHRHADARDRRRGVAGRGARDHRALVPGRTVRARVDRSLGRALRTLSGLRGDDLCLNTTATTRQPKFLQNLWDERRRRSSTARPLDLLRYRSNLLGADLRITNFGGGNTSSKFDMTDPLTGSRSG